MIEIQRFWDAVLKNRAEIDRCKKSISFWKNELSEFNTMVKNLKEKIKNLKGTIKSNEVDLSGLEDKCKKIESRKDLLKSERELDAQKAEFEKIKDECNQKEEVLINLMDELDADEGNLNKLNAELNEKDEQVKIDIKNLNLKINEFNSIITENLKNHENGLLNLLPVYKSKFEKLLNSKSGKAIGEVDGNICRSCNFEIPAYLAIESADDNKVVTCSNCGRYIFKIIR